MEQTPLGKAEWIKLYGALFEKEKEAKLLFDGIVKNYNDAKQVASQNQQQPFCMALCIKISGMWQGETAGLPIHEGC
jgi:hypothetical protein